MDNEKRLEIIKKVDTNAKIRKDDIIFKIDDIDFKYNVTEKKFYTDKDWFGKVPHILRDVRWTLWNSSQTASEYRCGPSPPR